VIAKEMRKCVSVARQLGSAVLTSSYRASSVGRFLSQFQPYASR
jgi:hypothetical protein